MKQTSRSVTVMSSSLSNVNIINTYLSYFSFLFNLNYVWKFHQVKKCLIIKLIIQKQNNSLRYVYDVCMILCNLGAWSPVFRGNSLAPSSGYLTGCQTPEDHHLNIN